MNVNNIANQCNYIPSSVCIDGQKGEFCAERNYSFRSPYYYESIISHLLNQSQVNSELDPSFLLPSSHKTEHTSSKEAIAMSPLPVYGFNNTNQFHNEHLQAKRARVENIIQGMNIMPNPIVSGTLEEEDQHNFEKVKESYRQNKRKQKLPQQQSLPGISLTRPPRSSISAEEFLQLKKQLHALQHQLKQLRERFLQCYEEKGSGPSQESIERTMALLKMYDPKLDTNSPVLCCDQHKDYLWKSTPKIRGLVLSEKEDTGIQNLEETTLSEILKQELIQVMTHAVDRVLKKVLPKSSSLQSQLPNNSIGTDPGGNTSSKWLPKISSPKGPISLITEKPPGFPIHPIQSKMERKPCQMAPVNYPLILASEVQEHGILSQMLFCGQKGHWDSPPPGMVSPESLEVPWQPIKLKSSVMKQQYPASHKSEVESLASLPSTNAVFAEMHAMVDGVYFSARHIQEALTPGHLKKAKLMFFFSRYPTSSLLKAYFLDIQFTRCITSQLIKWFSNFREFYYIQMEKFARQAVLEGITEVNDLIVTRDSELFQILNVHYNKGNDFEVPDGFLDVASLTLQEFFSAIRAGRDLDPSWKKPIYKIISKLDSEIPDVFKSSNCPKEFTQG
ncbi:prospero homeobox protein 2 [Liasis olivaceus]